MKTSILALMLRVTSTFFTAFTLFASEAKAQKDTIQTVTASQQAPLPLSRWNYTSSTDEMTGELSKSAINQSINTVEFDFPYEGPQHGFLGISKEGRKYVIYFSVERGQISSCRGFYQYFPILVRFDENEAINMSASCSIGSTMLFFKDDKRFMSLMRLAKSVRIAPTMYQQKTPIFRFNIEGFIPDFL